LIELQPSLPVAPSYQPSLPVAPNYQPSLSAAPNYQPSLPVAPNNNINDNTTQSTAPATHSDDSITKQSAEQLFKLGEQCEDMLRLNTIWEFAMLMVKELPKMHS
jgi:hypothetical protein